MLRKFISILTLCSLLVVMAAPAMCSAELLTQDCEVEQPQPVKGCCGGGGADVPSKPADDESDDGPHCPVCSANLCSGIVFLTEMPTEIGTWFEHVDYSSDCAAICPQGFSSDLLRPPTVFC